MRRSAAPSLKSENVSKKVKLTAPNSSKNLANKFGISLSQGSDSQDSSISSHNESDHNIAETDELSLERETNQVAEKSTKKFLPKTKFLPPIKQQFVKVSQQVKTKNEETAESASGNISSPSQSASGNISSPSQSASGNIPSSSQSASGNIPSSSQSASGNMPSPSQTIKRKKFLAPTRTSNNVNIKNNVANDENSMKVEEHYYSVVWCKASNKKHKKWDGDGILITKGKSAILKDLEGKIVSKGFGYKSCELVNMVDGSTLFVGGKEIEVQGIIDRDVYLSGKCFIMSSQTSTSSLQCPSRKVAPVKPFLQHQTFIDKDVKKSAAVITPRYNTDHPDAFVLERPNKDIIKQIGKDKQIVDVVVDPFISQYLRPHQKEGVKFMYNCVMGFQNTSCNGAILADEMGLGKTLQSIALVWTLLKQGPFNGKPVIKKCVVVAPGSLVKNWCKEFRKWLGSERLTPFGIDQKNRVDEYLLHMNSPVMVISYEMFLRCIEDIRKAKFDLIICDEAHRLKNSAIKTASAISSLFIGKRVLLTGTPIQNNLQEFYTLAEMTNPGVLGTLNAFRKIFIEPITQSQQLHCDAEVKELGEIRAKELTRLTSTFCLRRTADINKNYLPSKVEHVIFIRMSDLQINLYKHLLKSRSIRSCLTYLNGSGSKHLICIGALKKVCNDPKLVYQMAVKENTIDDDNNDSIYENITPIFPENYPDNYEMNSGKLSVLRHMLNSFHEKKEKVVLVSNSTKMLDILEEFCEKYDYTKVRLDGQTNVANRQQMVDRFNDKSSNIFVFLLSSKAGGVGLNLTGASNLILYDIDWNPANDLQAMARVWRDGQKNKVNIYRMIISGSIEEKIYQRQIIKQGLSGAVVDSLSISDKTEFSSKDLKDLLSYKTTTTCLTHELLQCTCDIRDKENVTATDHNTLTTATSSTKKNISMAELMKWEHIYDLHADDNLKSTFKENDNVTFVFRNVSS